MLHDYQKRPRLVLPQWETILPQLLIFLDYDAHALSSLLLVNKAWYHALLCFLSRTCSDSIQSHVSSPFTKLLFLAARTLHRAATQLSNRQLVYDQVALVQRETSLVNTCERLSYTATGAVLQRVSDLMVREHNVLHAPIHLEVAALRDVLLRYTYPAHVVTEISFWLCWRRENFSTVQFGDVCLSFGCTAPQCSMAKARTQAYTAQPDTLLQLHSALHANLWPCILRYIPFRDLDVMHTLSTVSPHIRSYFLSQPLLGPVLVHHETKRTLQAVQAQKHLLAYGLHELMLAAFHYKTTYHTLQHTVMRTNVSLQHAMVREFFKEAELYAETKSSTHLRMLVQLDRGLLQGFGIDARTLEHPCVTNLPPRAFFQSATETSRRNFQLPLQNEAAQYEGQRHHFLIQTQRLALTEARRTLWTTLRRVEAFELQLPQRVMKDLQTFSMMAPLSPIAKQLATPHQNSMLTFDTLNSITLELVKRLETQLDDTGVLHAVVDAANEVRRMLATMVKSVPPSLFTGYVSDVGVASCASWHSFARKLATEKSRVSMGLNVSTSDGFRLIFEERHQLWWPRVKPVPVRVLVAPLQIIGLFPLTTANSDLRIQDADVWIVITHPAAVTVVRRDNQVAQHLLSIFNASSQDVTAALHVHGILTGRCAPCGHVLKHGQSIGAKCKARLELV